jgi:hypothetical protein
MTVPGASDKRVPFPDHLRRDPSPDCGLQPRKIHRISRRRVYAPFNDMTKSPVTIVPQPNGDPLTPGSEIYISSHLTYPSGYMLLSVEGSWESVMTDTEKLILLPPHGTRYG